MSATVTKRKRGQSIVLPFETKAVDDEGKGRTFEGYLSTSHLDLGDGYMRDVVRPGAFKRWLKFFGKAKNPYVPLLDSHNRWTIMAALGTLLEAEEEASTESYEIELADGTKETVPISRLWSKWEVIEGSDGDQTLNRLRSKAVRQMSMGYASMREDYGTLATGQKFRNLWEVQVREGSLVIFAMQPEAQVDLATVKSMLRTMEDREDDLEDHERHFLEGLQANISKLLATSDEDGSADDEETPPSDPSKQTPVGPTKEQLEKLQSRVDRVLLGPLLDRISTLTQPSLME